MLNRIWYVKDRRSQHFLVNIAITMTTSHQDSSRQEVGSTAHAVAYMRGLESQKVDALIFDPYATALGAEIGELTTHKMMNTIESASIPCTLDSWVSGIGVRSRKIDQSIIEAIQHGIRQVVVLGAGLDTRPWRLDSNKDIDSSILSEVTWYEVDFKELFEFKLPLLNELRAKAAVNYCEIIADLSLNDWDTKLIDRGYLTNKPTFWLLEGLTGYLTENECLNLLDSLYQRSTSGSSMLATFVSRSRLLVNPLHRFYPENPLEIVNGIGWRGTQAELNDLAVEYGREKSVIWNGYKIIVAFKD